MDYLARMIAQLGFNEWLSLASALVAFISFMLSRAAVRRQEAMQIESLRADQDGRLITWADDAINALSDVQRHCRDLKNGLLGDDESKRNCSELRTRMQALLDRGRLFFPNQPDSAGEEPEQAAEAAYVGQSQPAIDALYNAYRIISDLGRTLPLSPAEAVNAVVAQRRRFVSEVFRSVDPRRRKAALEALGSQAGSSRR